VGPVLGGGRSCRLQGVGSGRWPFHALCFCSAALAGGWPVGVDLHWMTLLGHKPVISLFVSVHLYSTSILSAFVFANIHIHICIRFENMKHIHGKGTIQVSILRGFLLL
jgi:hypothetical protein